MKKGGCETVFKMTPRIDAELGLFLRIVTDFNVMLSCYVESLSRNMGCKTTIVVELLFPKSCKEIWPFPYFSKETRIWLPSSSLRVFLNLPLLCPYLLKKSK